MKRTVCTLLTIALALGLTAVAFAGEHPHHGHGGSAFAAIVHHYEAARLALLHDKTEGLGEHADEIKATAEQLAAKFSADQAGVPADKADAAKALLPEIAAAAGELAKAGDIAAARDAFYALSQPLVRYREMVAGDRPVVVYCPMAKKSWLQPEGEIGNPYYGQSMARCGEVVSRQPTSPRRGERG